MRTSNLPTDPATICDGDKAKLVALYSRVCPDDVLAGNDPRRDCIAAEMLDIGLAPSPKAAMEVIAWWDPIQENLKPIVTGVRRSFRSLKLEGSYEAASSSS